MNNNVLFVQWGNAIPGRESKNLETFMFAQEFFGGLKNQGAIESVDFVGFSTGNVTDSLGFMLVKGSPSQLSSLSEMDKFQEMVTMGRELCQNFCIQWGFTGETMKKRIEILNKVRGQLGIK